MKRIKTLQEIDNDHEAAYNWLAAAAALVFFVMWILYRIL